MAKTMLNTTQLLDVDLVDCPSFPDYNEYTEYSFGAESPRFGAESPRFGAESPRFIRTLSTHHWILAEHKLVFKQRTKIMAGIMRGHYYAWGYYITRRNTTTRQATRHSVGLEKDGRVIVHDRVPTMLPDYTESLEMSDACVGSVDVPARMIKEYLPTELKSNNYNSNLVVARAPVVKELYRSLNIPPK